MKIWVTRAAPGAERTASRLRTLGHDPLTAPVLWVRRLDVDPPDLTAVSAIAFTSVNAVQSFAARLSDRMSDEGAVRRIPVFAVGDATAAEAAALGFALVASADGDVSALARAMLKSHRGGVVLHPCATEAAGDLAAGLAEGGVRVRSYPLYETIGLDETPGVIAAALCARTLDVVMVHSPKAARVLKSLLDRIPREARASVGLAALSPACAAPLARCDFADIIVAPSPREDALLREIASWEAAG